MSTTATVPDVQRDLSNNVPDQLPVPTDNSVPAGSTADLENQAQQRFTSPNPAIQKTDGQQQPSLWRSILSGALQGLAAGGAVNTHGMSGTSAFAAGAGAGANQVLNVVPQQQAQLDNEKLQTAYHYVQLSQLQKQISQMPDSKQEAFLDQAADDASALIKGGAAVPISAPGDYLTTGQSLQSLHAQNPWAVYSIAPTRAADGTMQFQTIQYSKAPLQKDLPLPGANDDGSDAVIPAGTPADQVGKFYSTMLTNKLNRQAKSDLADQNNAARSALADKNNAAHSDLADKNNAARNQRAAITAAGQNVVAWDPDYQNTDGSKGANVVLDKATAQQRGFFSYKADPSTINSTVAGFNDVQTKLNQLADVVNDKNVMTKVQPGAAAAIIAHDKGVSLTMSGHGGGASGGIGVDTSRFNEWNYNAAVKEATPETLQFVNAFNGAHEAITQLPRLQTFGKSSRMTETQLTAALNLLPQPGDTPSFAQDKMHSLQTMVDPLRRQLPHMPGAELIPSWLEKRAQTPKATHMFDATTGLLNLINQQGGGQ